VIASHPTRRNIISYKNSRQSFSGIGRLFLMSGVNINCNGHKHCDKGKYICPSYHKHHPFRKARIGIEARPPTSHESTLYSIFNMPHHLFKLRSQLHDLPQDPDREILHLLRGILHRRILRIGRKQHYPVSVLLTLNYERWLLSQ